ncbi:MAG: PAS domain-containing sensor histidine kinase [Alphaproteobacteria bacterium]|nr:PAS domain-containing sensor histidine kinase [Alphaproteobacteria bacterium]
MSSHTNISNSLQALKGILTGYLPIMHARPRVSRGAGQNIVALILVILTAASCIATYAALNEVPPFGDDPDTVIWLLTLDLVFLLALMVMVARRVASLWSGRKRGLAGSHLHVRLIYIFSVMAAVPAIIMTVFSVFFFNFGIQTWFSDRVQTAVLESQAVAEAYLEEHKQVIRADTLAMANDIDRQAGLFLSNKDAFDNALQAQSFIRNLAEAVIFDSSGRVMASSGITFSLEFEEIPSWALERADDGEVALMTGANDDRVRALIRLNNFIGTYLFVGRMVDPKVLSHLAAAQQASDDYQDLQKRASQLQILVAMIFTIIGFLLMCAAIWLGFLLARQLVMPIADLIDAADRVREGDLTTQIHGRGKVEEFDYLALAFNRMTKQIQEQQSELLDANAQLDRRRRFTETVLAGATSGIVGVDSQEKITLANASACKLLNIAQDRLLGLKIRTVSPDTAKLLEAAHEKPHKISQEEITIHRSDIGTRIFLVRVAIELIEDGVNSKDVGAIITFDDITDLQSAQRKAAWSDVARRIAHEIKNPLTPIQLSAERLKRKYLKDIKNDPETFEQCTDTIIRHVEDIGHMVNEFSAFARMPDPTLETQDLGKVVVDTVSLHQNGHSGIAFHVKRDSKAAIKVSIDAKQIRQALNNLIQNAADSVDAKYSGEKGGSITLEILTKGMDDVVIAVIDNGMGLPEHTQEDQLLEPYVTHKTKGTGLGLAIVKKIMEDHNGEILLSPSDDILKAISWDGEQGACVCLTLPKV